MGWWYDGSALEWHGIGVWLHGERGLKWRHCWASFLVDGLILGASPRGGSRHVNNVCGFAQGTLEEQIALLSSLTMPVYNRYRSSIFKLLETRRHYTQRSSSTTVEALQPKKSISFSYRKS